MGIGGIMHVEWSCTREDRSLKRAFSAAAEEQFIFQCKKWVVLRLLLLLFHKISPLTVEILIVAIIKSHSQGLTLLISVIIS